MMTRNEVKKIKLQAKTKITTVNRIESELIGQN